MQRAHPSPNTAFFSPASSAEADLQKSKSSEVKHKKIEWVDRIEIPHDMREIYVEMDRNYVTTCTPDNNFLLFTSRLGPCIGVVARCETKEGTIIGVSHMSPGSLRCERKTVENMDPCLFNDLIDQMKKLALVDDQQETVIEVYLAGGQGEWRGLYELFFQYIQNRKDLKLCDIGIDPYKTLSDLHRFEEKVWMNIFTTFGIASDGRILAAKRLNLQRSIDEFKTNEELLKYCAEQKITIPLIRESEVVHSFQNPAPAASARPSG